MIMKEFKIATFNLRNLDDKDQKKFDERMKVLQPMIERVDADLFFLQEVNTLSALDSLINGTIYQQENYHSEHTTKKNGKPYPERNLVILSRYPIKAKHQYLHNLVKNPKWMTVTSKPPQTVAKKISWERPILHCEIDLGSQTLDAINLHLKSMIPTPIPGQQDSKKYWLWFSNEGWAEGYFISDVKRVGQALEARILIEKLLQQDPLAKLIAVAGDFNADIGSVPFKAIAGSVMDTSNPDLRSTALVPCEYNVPRDQRFSLLHHGEGNMLDHVLVSNALYPYWEGTSIFNELLPDESVPFASEIFPDSDHAPVVAKFLLPDSWLQ
jgi:endonuclease/exonuclease/phosphatase family metal-dependent hydrolase